MVRGFIAALVVMLVGTIVVLFSELRGRTAGDLDRVVRVQELQQRLEDIEAEKRALADQLASRAAEIEALTRAKERAVRAVDENEARLALATAKSDAPRSDSAVRPTAPASLVDDARMLQHSIAARGDLIGWFELLLDLLTLGEPGYAKAVELFGEITPKDPRFRALFRDQELVMGRLFSSIDDSVGNILDFGLYLADLDPDEMPEDIRRLRDELLYDEVSTVLLGYYAEGEPRLLDAYAAHYRDLLLQVGDAAVPRHKARDLVRSLANIPTESAFDALVECIELDTVDLRTTIQAIALHGSPRALGVLRQLEQGMGDGRDRETVQAAIRYVDGRP